jgi:hypothetical protein
MLIVRRTIPRAIAALALLAVAVACSDDSPTDAGASPIAGLVSKSATDSVGNAPPTVPPGNATAGSFHGTVLGPSQPGAGNDSLQTAPRVAGATVTAYPVLSGSGASARLGTAVATAITGADGKFRLGTMPGGEYVVTIVPPASSIYAGVWVTAIAHATSDVYPWWVVLPRKS